METIKKESELILLYYGDELGYQYVNPQKFISAEEQKTLLVNLLILTAGYFFFQYSFICLNQLVQKNRAATQSSSRLMNRDISFIENINSSSISERQTYTAKPLPPYVEKKGRYYNPLNPENQQYINPLNRAGSDPELFNVFPQREEVKLILKYRYNSPKVKKSVILQQKVAKLKIVAKEIFTFRLKKPLLEPINEKIIQPIWLNVGKPTVNVLGNVKQTYCNMRKPGGYRSLHEKWWSYHPFYSNATPFVTKEEVLINQYLIKPSTPPVEAMYSRLKITKRIIGRLQGNKVNRLGGKRLKRNIFLSVINFISPVWRYFKVPAFKKINYIRPNVVPVVTLIPPSVLEAASLARVRPTIPLFSFVPISKGIDCGKKIIKAIKRV